MPFRRGHANKYHWYGRRAVDHQRHSAEVQRGKVQGCWPWSEQKHVPRETDAGRQFQVLPPSCIAMPCLVDKRVCIFASDATNPRLPIYSLSRCAAD